MEKIYAEQLYEKKIQFEEALEMEMNLLDVTKKNIKHMTEESEPPMMVECFVKDKEHRELVTEALQDSIDGIDNELRSEGLPKEEIQSPKDEPGFYWRSPKD